MRPTRPNQRRRPIPLPLVERLDALRLLSASAAADEPAPDGGDLPDLAVTVPQLFPRSTRTALAAGDGATLSLTLSNVGGADADAPLVGRVVLSRDTVVSSDDLVLTTFEAANLPAGSAVPITSNVTLPDSRTDDTWYAIAAVESEGTVAEADVSNNVAVGSPLTLPAKRFSLVSATVPTSVRAGEAFTVSGTAYVTGLQVDDPSFMSATLRRPGSTVDLQPDLAPLVLPVGTDGSTEYALVVFTCTLSLPESAAPGPYTLELAPVLFKGAAAVDAGYGAPTVNVAADVPFLSVATPAVESSTVRADEPFDVIVTVQSSGDTATRNATLSYYLSSTPELTDGAQLLGTSFVAPLAPGDTRTLRPSLTASVPPGRYYLITTLAAPHAGAFAETSTTVSAPVPLTLIIETEPGPTPEPEPEPEPIPTPEPPPTDLSLSSLSAPARTTVGASIRVTVSPSVTGPAVRYVLSTTPDLSSSSVVLGTLAAATAADLKLPTDLAPGTYYVLATIDPEDAIAEASEANNTAVAAAPISVVRPELKGTLAGKSAVVRTGATSTLVLNVANARNGMVRRNYSVKYYLSADQIFSADDTRVAKQKLPLALGRKQSRTVEVRYTVPEETPLGGQYLIAVLDAPGVAAGHLELVSGAIQVTAPRLSAQVKSVKRTGSSAVVTLRLTNTGTAVQDTPVMLQLSTPTRRKPLVTARASLNLAPRKSVRITVPIPAGAAKDLDVSALSATIL